MLLVGGRNELVFKQVIYVMFCQPYFRRCYITSTQVFKNAELTPNLLCEFTVIQSVA
jgi:hypothetical protein